MQVDEPLDVDTIMSVRALNSDAARVVDWALRMEGALHQIADHAPPDKAAHLEWCIALARWAIRPALHERPPCHRGES